MKALTMLALGGVLFLGACGPELEESQTPTADEVSRNASELRTTITCAKFKSAWPCNESGSCYWQSGVCKQGPVLP